ncbi:twin-arginine translocation signal domain-containing protein [Sphingobacterium sp. E70]|uniref:twin-arginine translocation signal domain-containing protein n=1 Tax=Sphingobacterium sp. E70 TaxID=2853439 RepID=UPI00211BA50A|nr:twin-arginine translocation signal domain-containing protein [Sphingobacterium sp. E70]ULT23090.1 twin-arginine translocation signal domain-containing protein [Sphingobacterium sp. E70]
MERRKFLQSSLAMTAGMAVGVGPAMAGEGNSTKRNCMNGANMKYALEEISTNWNNILNPH